MSDDPVAVIYSASLNGALIFVPRAQMEIRAPSPDQVHGLEGLVCGQVQKVPVPTGSPSALRYSLRNLRVGKAVFRPPSPQPPAWGTRAGNGAG